MIAITGNLASYVNETLMGEMASPFATEFFEKCAREHGNRTVMEIVVRVWFSIFIFLITMIESHGVFFQIKTSNMIMFWE